MSDSGSVARLREALVGAGYTYDGCLDVLGPLAHAALARYEGVPALRATRGGTPLETLIRLFLLQAAVPEGAASAALPLEDALAGGLLAREGGEVRALVDIRPYGDEECDWWVVSDLGGSLADGSGHGGASPRGGGGPHGTGPLPPDHVLGVGGASTALAGLTVRDPVASALDIGTGCGVQALHLSRHAASVTATDVNPRALDCARLTIALSAVKDVELLDGSFFTPVEGRRFELIVSNPPFVISPAASHTYCDGGLPGDEVCRSLVAAAPAHLAEGGWCQLLANWLHVEGDDWRERLAGWVVPTGCDAWVVQREVLDPASYVETWLRDAGEAAGPDYVARYDAWLDYFAEQRVEAVGMGWITLRSGGSDRPQVRIEEAVRQVEQPLGPVVRATFARRAFLREREDEELLGVALAVSPEVRLERTDRPSYDDAGWRQESRRIRLDAGMFPVGEIDPVGAAVLAGCDGTRPLGEVLAAVAREQDLDLDAFREGALGVVRSLVDEGFLLPPFGD